MSRLLGAASVLALSLTVAPTPVSAEQQQQAQQSDAARNRIVCRGDRFTGSRIAARRRCRTVAQWEAEESYARNVSHRAIENREGRPVEGSSDAPPTLGAGPSSPFIPPRN